MSLAVVPGSVPLIRAMVRRIADAWGYDGSVVDATELVVSEISTNVILHTGTSGCGCFGVRMVPRAHGLRIEVSDEGPGTPSGALVDGMEESGRGLFLVNAMCQRWGVQEVFTGKVVWAEIGADAA